MDLPKANTVRAMIDLFESNRQQTTSNRLNRPMSKSFTGLSNLERTRRSNSYVTQDSLCDIEDNLTSLILKLERYRTYNKETHVAIQNDLVNILGNLINIDTNNSNTIMYKKRELMRSIKVQLKELNDKLPLATEKNGSNNDGNLTYKPFTSTRRKSNDSQSLSILRSLSSGIPGTSKYIEEQEPLLNNTSTHLVIGGSSGTLQSLRRNGPFGNTQRSPVVIGGSAGTFHSPVEKITLSTEPQEIIIGGEAGILKDDSKSEVQKTPQRFKGVSATSDSPQTAGETMNILPKPPLFIIGGSAGTQHFREIEDEVHTLETGNNNRSQHTSLSNGDSSPVSPVFGGSFTNLQSPDYEELKFDLIQRTPSVIEKKLKDSESSESALNPKKTLIIGGISGTKQFSGRDDLLLGSPVFIGGNSGIFKKTVDNENGFDNSKQIVKGTGSPTTAPQIIGGSPGILQPFENDEILKYPEVGEVEEESCLSNFRTPVMIGGTPGTLRGNDDDEDVLSSRNLNRKDEHTDDSIQSVNMLKRFFELKASYKTKFSDQKLSDVQYEQPETVSGYFRHLEPLNGNDQNEENDISNTVELSDARSTTGNIEENDLDADEQEFLNTSTEEEDDIQQNGGKNGNGSISEVISANGEHGSREDLDYDDIGSISSGHSIYVDPID